MDKIKIGIVGYGNIGRGVEQAIKRNDDMELALYLQEEICYGIYPDRRSCCKAF